MCGSNYESSISVDGKTQFNFSLKIIELLYFMRRQFFRYQVGKLGFHRYKAEARFFKKCS